MRFSSSTALLLLVLLGQVHAQGRPSDEQIAQWRAQRDARGGGGEYTGPRPPENASPEERRAFWQKRAAERAQSEGAASPSTPTALAAGAHQHGTGAAATPSLASQGKAEQGKANPSKPGAAAASGGATAMSGMAGMGAMSGAMAGGMGSRGAGSLWLSDAPPMRGEGQGSGRMAGMSGMGGMGGMGSMGSGDRSGPPTKRLWLRAGTDPMKSGFAREDADNPPETLLITPSDAKGTPLAAPEEGKRNYAFPTPNQGFYRVYITSRKLQGDTLSVSVAKAELPYFSHGGDETEKAEALKSDRVWDGAPLEIVRVRKPDEKVFFQLRSGDEQSFQVLQKGLPVQGARVRFISHQGWSKDAVSDEQGRVSFQVIRDYFPNWEDFQKRFKATYLLVADVSSNESGKYKDQAYSAVRYQATLSGNYYPDPDDYRSYAWGLGIGFVSLALMGGAIYLYRRRRVKPFQEVHFHEKD